VVNSTAHESLVENVHHVLVTVNHVVTIYWHTVKHYIYMYILAAS